MSDLYERLCEAMAEYLRRLDLDVAKVTAYDEDIDFGQGCPTCSYTSIEVVIYYDNTHGGTDYYYYDGSLGGLISEL